MSDIARTALTVVCYSVAVLAQVAAIALLVTEGRRTATALRRWRDAEGAGRAGLVEALLGNRFDRTAAVVLLAVGVVLGAIGHLLSV